MGWNVNDLGSQGAPLAFSRPAANATEGTQYIVYQGFTAAQGGNGRLHLFLWETSGWHYRGELTDAGLGAPLAEQFTDLTSYYFSAQNTQHVDYIAVDGHIWELLFDSDGWSAHDLSHDSHARIAALNGPSGFEFAGLQQLFYRGTDLHVQELSWDIAGWHPRDLTLQTGSPLVHASGPTCYGFRAQLTQHVIYVASGEITGGHVHELWRDRHGNWHDGGNLTALTGAPLADGQPTGYAYEAQLTQHVHYRGVDGHIHELRWGSDTNGWHYRGNLSALTGAPQAAGDPRGYVFVQQDTQHVVYQGVDGHIHELWWDSGTWHHNDLTLRTSAPLAGSDPTGYTFRYLRNSQHVIYNSAEHHIVELAWTPLATNPHLPADLTGTGRADLVGFGDAGVWVALGKGDGTFDFPQLAIPDLGYVAGGWRVDRHPRLLADLTGDRRADIVGFGDAGVYVALSNGDGSFAYTPSPVVADFGYQAGGWRVDRHPRLLADLTGTGRADLVGFGNDGVWVSLGRGDGTFEEPQFVVAEFGYLAGGWRVDRHPRYLTDLTGNGIADIVAFGDDGVWVALGRGDGTFETPRFVLEDFGYIAGGWRVERHPRFLADLTGNGRADIMGFGNDGVYVALGRGDGTFEYAAQPVIADFGYLAGGWRVERHPRLLADLTGNGRADIVGFGNLGVYVAFSRGDGSFDFVPQVVLGDFGYGAGGWRVERNQRLLACLTGNGRADIIGFADVGVRTSLSDGNGGFLAKKLAAPDFGFDARNW
jgi:hypothetical protein